MGLLRSLKQSDARASEVAWSLLLDLGMEVFDEVLRLADAGEEEAENALLGLNQAAVRAEWHELVRRADAPAAGERATSRTVRCCSCASTRRASRRCARRGRRRR